MSGKKKTLLKFNKVRVLGFTLIILVLILVLIVSIRIFMEQRNSKTKESYVQIQEDGTKLNTSEKLAETKMIDGIEIKDITLKEKDNITVLEATALNTTNQTKEGFLIDIEFVDDNNQTITTIIANISSLQPGEFTIIRTQTTLDFANSYNINITKK